MVANGPIVEIQLWVSRSLQEVLRKKGQSIPDPVKVTAMIDTGASGTVVNPSVIQALGIQPVGVTAIKTPSTTAPVLCHQYELAVLFPNNVVIDSCIAVEAPLQGQHIKCLIGRNILAHGVLIYTGYTNYFHIEFLIVVMLWLIAQI